MLKKTLLIVLLTLLPILSHAFGLTYRLTNASNSVVTFGSTDWYDFGVRVSQGQKKQSWYIFTPKDMYLTVYNADGSYFSLMTTAGCDIVGLPPYRQPSSPSRHMKGHSVRMTSGIIDIVIADLPGSTQWNKQISCSVIGG